MLTLKLRLHANAISFFKKTGIYPFNADVFQDWEFAAASTTDREITNEDQPQSEIEDEI